ncbi:netrin-A-like isoform X2 [Drosophila bipectinata]
MSNMLDTQNTAPKPDEPEASHSGGATAGAAAQSPYYRSETTAVTNLLKRGQLTKSLKYVVVEIYRAI